MNLNLYINSNTTLLYREGYLRDQYSTSINTKDKTGNTHNMTGSYETYSTKDYGDRPNINDNE